MSRKSTCVRKKPYITEEQANNAVEDIYDNNFVINKLRAYRCKYCHFWHIGHVPNEIDFARFDGLKPKTLNQKLEELATLWNSR